MTNLSVAKDQCLTCIGYYFKRRRIRSDQKMVVGEEDDEQKRRGSRRTSAISSSLTKELFILSLLRLYCSIALHDSIDYSRSSVTKQNVAPSLGVCYAGLFLLKKRKKHNNI